MPVVKIERIVSCSSEDPNYPAHNLINTDNKKWRCKNAGEKVATVVFQLEKETKIGSIDIGNDNCAFVEVLVGRSSSPDVDFEVLLVASSFMSPMEARNGSNSNRVRMFTADALSKPTVEQKWDRVKVVCTQPFNKHIQYGLTFIIFRSLMDDDNSDSSSNKLGRFIVKDDDDTESISVGSLFARRKEIEHQPLRGAAAIREASSPAALAKQKLEKTMKPVPDKKIGSPTVHEISSSHAVIRQKPGPVNPAPAKQGKDNCRQNGSQKEKPRNSDWHGGSSPKKKKDPVVKKPKLIGKPFGELLEDVVLVISGYQNPHRGNLRTMALEMGARYKSDWDASCTHLICAFPNTPKFQQVWGKGHIVRKEWIESCHAKRRRLPWRRFALDKRDQNKPESEEEIPELIQSVTNSSPRADWEGGSDADQQPLSGSDTEDEIERLRASNPYDEDTDVDSDTEQPNTSNMPLPNLSSIFDGKFFHLHEDLSPDVKNQLRRYILAFKGSLSDQMDDCVDFIVANKQVKSGCVVVKPEWVWECNDAEALVPTPPYEIH